MSQGLKGYTKQLTKSIGNTKAFVNLNSNDGVKIANILSDAG